jgi:hypothetical protein
VVALAVECVSDPVLSAVAPLILAAAHPSALVVDVGGGRVALPGSGSLARLVADGPRLEDLRPARSGVAVLANGGVEPADVAEVLGALVKGWPVVVVRGPSPVPMPRAPVDPLFPGGPGGAAIRVRTGLAGVDPPGPGPVVAAPSRAAVARMLGGGLPPRRLVRSWAAAWRHPWR